MPQKLFVFVVIPAALIFFWGAERVHAATLSLSPDTAVVTIGETFTVDIVLDTEGADVSGVDINTLSFNFALLSVEDADGEVSGTQIIPGALMAETLINTVDEATGDIVFSQVAEGATTYTGSGVLARIEFLAEGAGTAELSFSFTPGATTDTNVARAGADVLSGVGGAVIEVVSASESGGDSSGSSGSGGGTATGGSSGGSGGSSAPGSEGGSVGESTSGGSAAAPVSNPLAAKVSALAGPFAIGMQSDQVALLQEILATDHATYPEGIVSGYYGPLTQRAVERFQIKYGVVMSGTPDITGFGLAGPQTRAKIKEVFGGGAPFSIQGSGGGLTDAARQALIAELKEQIRQLMLLYIDLLTELVEELSKRVGTARP